MSIFILPFSFLCYDIKCDYNGAVYTMSFRYEKTAIEGKEGIRILSFEGNVRKLNVPGSLDGLPVLSLGKQALSENNWKRC